MDFVQSSFHQYDKEYQDIKLKLDRPYYLIPQSSTFQDMRVKVTRDEFNELLNELRFRMVAPVHQAVVMAELTMDQVCLWFKFGLIIIH